MVGYFFLFVEKNSWLIKKFVWYFVLILIFYRMLSFDDDNVFKLVDCCLIECWGWMLLYELVIIGRLLINNF